jgi:ketosteroid isomerase-like protein
MRSSRTVPVVITVVAAALTACGTTAPAVLTEADRDAIGDVTEAAVQMANEATEWTAYTDLYYAEDAIILPPNAEAIRGREQIASFFGTFPPISDMRFEQIDVGGARDVAYVYGTYSMVMTPEGGEPEQDSGKYIEVWKRQADGSWKVTLDIFNSDLPLPSSESQM